MRPVLLALLFAPLVGTACGKSTVVPEDPRPTGPASPSELQRIDASPTLVGAWASSDGTTHERWVGVGEHLVGIGFTSGDGDATTGFFEVMLLHHTDGRTILTAMPLGSSQVDFAVATERNMLRFSNPEHDDPTQIVYRREGERLAITLEGQGGSRDIDLQATAPIMAPELEDLDLAFSADSTARGGAAWAERFESQGVTWPRGSTPSQGPEAIGAGIDAMRAEGRELTWAPTASGLAPAADMAFTSGRYEIHSRDGDQRLGGGTYVTIWRRGADGWRIAFDTGVSDPRPSPSPS